MVTTNRKRGTVRKLLVEIDSSQYDEFDRVCAKMELTKADAVSKAINIWLSMVAPKGVSNG